MYLPTDTISPDRNDKSGDDDVKRERLGESDLEGSYREIGNSTEIGSDDTSSPSSYIISARLVIWGGVHVRCGQDSGSHISGMFDLNRQVEFTSVGRILHILVNGKLMRLSLASLLVQVVVDPYLALVSMV